MQVKNLGLNIMFSWATRKEQCSDIILYIQKILYKITSDDETSGFLVFLLHYHVVGFTWWYLAFGPRDRFFWASVVFYVGLFISNLYFRGCICIKAERKLFEDDGWYGPWMAEEDVTVPRIRVLIRRWVAINIFLIVGRGTNLIRGPIF